jgi:hypothetical protein
MVYLFVLFIYKIQLVAVVRLYKLFRIAFLKYEIVRRIDIFMRNQIKKNSLCWMYLTNPTVQVSPI